jgi:hypothetical protein
VWLNFPIVFIRVGIQEVLKNQPQKMNIGISHQPVTLNKEKSA